MNFTSSLAALPAAVQYIERELSKKKLDPKTRAKTLLTAEEVLRAAIEHADSEENELSVKLISSPLFCELRVSAKGSPFDVSAPGTFSQMIHSGRSS